MKCMNQSDEDVVDLLQNLADMDITFQALKVSFIAFCFIFAFIYCRLFD